MELENTLIVEQVHIVLFENDVILYGSCSK
jgi:hypothetical protein